MLAIEVEFLLGRSYCGSARNRNEPEWPPHPARLFSALVSAYHEVRLGEPARQALEWLEAQEPPRILASPLRSVWLRDRVTTFVAENYTGSHPQKEKRGKQPRVFPVSIPEEPVVVFEWKSATPTAEIEAALAEMSGYVAYLGQSRSLVRVSLRDSAVVANFLPDEDGSMALRVPRPGRLAALESLYEAGRYSPEAPQQNYRESSGPQVENGHGLFGEMVVFLKTAGPGLPIESSLLLTEATRKALMSLAGRYDLETDLLDGHGRHPHCAYVALPFVAAPYADGHLLGVAVVLPRAISNEDRRRVLMACGLLEEIALSEKLDNWKVEPAEEEALTTGLRARSWQEASRFWATATPILLDRFPKKNRSTESILVECCRNQGLPDPVEILHQPFEVLKGSQSVQRFRLQRKGEDRARWGVHAALRFAVPVEGPLLLGAGRYFGLGLLRPVQTRDFREILKRANQPVDGEWGE